jgi:protein-S-isoprenylcysteine O-methyltransferase Ste14
MRKELSKTSITKAVVSMVMGPVIIAAIVFISAGRFLYWQGILYIAVLVISMVMIFLNAYKNPDLINERLKPGKGTLWWDKIYFILSTPLYFITIIVGSLDTGRFFWSPELPVYLYVLSLVLYLTGQVFFIWAKKTNHFFSSVVRIQKDRGQSVCMEGPYRYIRHPGYLGGILFTAAIPFILGSLYAIIPAALALILMIIRVELEDAVLAKELAGYAEYRQKVKRKIIPHLW